ncbi:MAG: FeoA family protein [Planctomycetota bacterium]|jgi:Fe2+ transport system protein FeoA
MEHKHKRSLSKVKAGEKVRIVDVEAGGGFRSKLIAMGLLPNSEITVVSNGHPGPFVISVKNSKVMLGRGMAEKITVM